MISPDTKERLAGLWKEKALSFPSLLDPDARVIRLYGILNPGHPPLPHPTTLVIDKQGVIRWMQVNEDYKVRPAAKTVLEALEKVEGAKSP